MDDVEAVVGERETIGIADLERHGQPGRPPHAVRAALEGRLRPIDTDDPAGRHDPCQVDRDRARSAADVEQVLAGRRWGSR